MLPSVKKQALADLRELTNSFNAAGKVPMKEKDAIYNQYKKLSEKDDSVIFGGRLAEYKYYDMHQIIASALTKTKLINE